MSSRAKARQTAEANPRYSGLDQINVGNANQMKVARTFNAGGCEARLCATRKRWKGRIQNRFEPLRVTRRTGC